jgi:hypothetical protein
MQDSNRTRPYKNSGEFCEIAMTNDENQRITALEQTQTVRLPGHVRQSLTFIQSDKSKLWH